MHSIVYPNLKVKIVFHDSYWTIFSLTDPKFQKTWAVYDKYEWFEKLKRLEKELVLSNHEDFLTLIKT